jgi:hypothetical protein
MAAILNTVPEDFIVLSGDDAIALPLIALGGPRRYLGGLQRILSARTVN